MQRNAEIGLFTELSRVAVAAPLLRAGVLPRKVLGGAAASRHFLPGLATGAQQVAMDTVLIVLEDAEIRHGLQTSLQALTGLRVIAAGDEKTGLERLAGEAVDLLVTELKFAQGDGLALIAFLSVNRPATPRVVLTERSLPGGAQWRQGLYCLAMPFESFHLAAVVRQGLTRRGEAAGISLRSLLPLVAEACTDRCRCRSGQRFEA
jgi:CheY-like chemotaxis protein